MDWIPEVDFGRYFLFTEHELGEVFDAYQVYLLHAHMNVHWCLVGYTNDQRVHHLCNHVSLGHCTLNNMVKYKHTTLDIKVDGS